MGKKHLTLAGTNASAPAAATHCPHAKGAGPCSSANATAFCTSLATVCNTSNPMTATLGGTVSMVGMVACENFFANATGTGDTGATQGCYNKHLALAGTNATA